MLSMNTTASVSAMTSLVVVRSVPGDGKGWRSGTDQLALKLGSGIEPPDPPLMPLSPCRAITTAFMVRYLVCPKCHGPQLSTPNSIFHVNHQDARYRSLLPRC